jgi:hypothetical protein
MKIQLDLLKTNSRPSFRSSFASCKAPLLETAPKIAELYQLASNRINMNLKLESEWKTLLAFLDLFNEQTKNEDLFKNLVSEINLLIPENITKHKIIERKLQKTVTDYPHGGPWSTDIHLLVTKPEGHQKYSHITFIEDGSPLNRILIAIQDTIIPASVDVNHFKTLMARHIDTFDQGQQSGIDYVKRFLLPTEAGGDKDLQRWVDFRTCWSKVFRYLQEKEKTM